MLLFFIFTYLILIIIRNFFNISMFHFKFRDFKFNNIIFEYL